ncbi:phosphomethylpyrimidine kinase [Lentilactobacillus rapi DSM 19907 = JCM 15042]|uniref:pyridoxal kinase n=2 Tax=Lentilactobacillus rapi TaxID=481723 RepID=A0A512PL63_9LACO|nr:PfkB family carbohydrate kinase [Lentilactobacillus rapi]KRL18300.1 phosphomethylpyrimidine kinase [Lentilactobacillus rapi DSM 19907 = JCM 15042]GEP71918.1 pyridoxal kinase [Lentilactobacillus rapi]
MSITAAISTFAAFGIQTAAVPTEILSTQSEGFGQPAVLNLDDWMTKAFKHWDHLADLNIESAVIGYVGKIQTCRQLADQLTRLKLKRILVDPVMGDRGEMYAGFGEDYLEAIKQLVKLATVITPNMTELGLLSGTKLTEQSTDDQLIAAIQACDTKATVIITGVKRDGGIGSCFLRGDKLIWISSPILPGHFYGTGDLFAALLGGYLNFEMNFESAVKRAVFGTYEAVVQTNHRPTSDRKYGLDLTKTLYDVARFTLGQNREEV